MLSELMALPRSSPGAAIYSGDAGTQQRLFAFFGNCEFLVYLDFLMGLDAGFGATLLRLACFYYYALYSVAERNKLHGVVDFDYLLWLSRSIFL